MSKNKIKAEAKTANTRKGSGDYYGKGVKQPVGKMRDSLVVNDTLTPKSLKIPPRSLA